MAWASGDLVTSSALNYRSGNESNVRDSAYGAVGDGSTDDAASIQTAMTQAARIRLTVNGIQDEGGIVFLPPGIYSVQTTLSIPSGVVLRGAGKETTTISADSVSFPAASPVIDIGDGTSNGVIGGGRLENLAIDCSSVTSSIGIRARNAHEHSGAHNVKITRFKDVGLLIDGSSANAGWATWEKMHILSSEAASTSTGILVKNAGGAAQRIHDTTVVNNNGTAQSSPAIQIATSGGWLTGIHVEHYQTGVLFSDNPNGQIFSLSGHNSITSLVVIDDDSSVACVNLNASGAAVTLQDTSSGLTSASGVLGLYTKAHNDAGSFVLASDSNIGLYTDSLRINTNAPAAGDSAGTAGNIAWAVSSGVTYLYVCVSANSWMRAALNPF